MSQLSYEEKIKPFNAEIIADSVSPHGHRLTSMEIIFPRPFLPEFNTHRMFSRNSASSRAIPVMTQIKRVLRQPYIPPEWGEYQKGMQSGELLGNEYGLNADEVWLEQSHLAVLGAVALLGGVEHIKSHTQLSRGLDNHLEQELIELRERYAGRIKSIGKVAVHKQTTNRLLEPFSWHEVLVTATEWQNFFALRASAEAQPEIRMISELMIQAYLDSEPTELDYDQWHTPLVGNDEEFEDQESKIQVSAARSGRLSYLTHRSQRPHEADVERYHGFVSDGHMSPLEHVARPFSPEDIAAADKIIQSDAPDWIKKWIYFHGNFRGWHQLRKLIPHEDDFGARP